MKAQIRAGALTILLAVGLVACGDRAAAPAQPPPKPPNPAQAPVNPDAGVTSYACADGQTITAGYPDAETAIVTYKDHAYTLKLAHSASGARYTGYGLQWWTKGAHASMSALAPGEEVASAPSLECDAVPAAAEPATRT